jgi:hypothetical protein
MPISLAHDDRIARHSPSLIVERRFKALVCLADDARQKEVGLVHQRFASIADEHAGRLIVVKVRLQGDNPVHLANILGNDRVETIDDCIVAGGRREKLLQQSKIRQRLGFGRIVGSEIYFIASDQIPPLAGLSGLQRARSSTAATRSSRVLLLNSTYEFDFSLSQAAATTIASNVTKPTPSRRLVEPMTTRLDMGILLGSRAGYCPGD